MDRWKEMYNQKLTTPDEAVKLIENGDRIIVPISNGQPPALVAALAERIKKGELRDSLYLDALNVHCPEICTPDVVKNIHYENGYASFINRDIVNTGVAEANSVRFSDGERLIGQRGFHVAMYTVSPMDKHGFFSCGTNADFAYVLSRRDIPNKKILLEVNEKMPKTYGYNYIHVSEADVIVENNAPLLCIPEVPVTKEDEAIGRYIAEHIPDGACIQLGIGGVPNAVGKFLEDKKDLGVHTEMICDSMIDLYYKGVITCKKKNYNRDKWMATFVMGSQRLYDFVDDNPMIEVWGAEWINNPRMAGKNDNLMSVNTTLEIDLAGQCASESIGYRQYSGVGGQVDFVVAAWYSKGGKSFMATYSTYIDKEGNLQSKIVPVLNNFITVGRLEIQYVVTEYGIAYLRGESISTRTKQLINIAHPDFRDWLRFEAKKRNYIV